MKKEKKKSNQVTKEGIEELLTRLRKEKGWSYAEVLQHLEDKTLTEKDIKKWEIGLKYPDLDMIYQLCSIYQIPSEEFVEAKNNSYAKGMLSINMITIKLICYFLNVSLKVGAVILVLLYVFLFAFSLYFFTMMASQVKRAY